jgi:hypothetical protein
MAAFLDVCRFTPSAGGTTDWTYAVAATGYQSPAAAGVVNGRLYKYRAESADLSQWEVGEGVYNTSTGVLARTTVLFNSSGTSTKINFSTTPQVGIVALKEDLISVEESNRFTATQKARARANLDVLKKNYVINGGMQISQENGATASATSGYYAADQWRNDFSNGGTISFGQISPSFTPGGSPFRIRTTVTAADAAVVAADYSIISQRIEGVRCADLAFGSSAAKGVTIQFGIKAPAGTYCVALRNATPSRIIVGEYTIAAGEANTDVVKSVTFAGDISGTWALGNSTGIELIFVLMAGSSFQQTANTWASAGSTFATSNQFNLMGTNGNVFELFDVGIYEGDAAPSFQLPDFSDELDRCQRYWEKSYDYATAVGTATNNGVRGSLQNSAPAAYGAGTFLIRKRTAPTVTLYSPNNGASGNGFDSTNRAASAANVGETQFMIVNVFGIASTPILYHYTANARL